MAIAARTSRISSANAQPNGPSISWSASVATATAYAVRMRVVVNGVSAAVGVSFNLGLPQDITGFVTLFSLAPAAPRDLTPHHRDRRWQSAVCCGYRRAGSHRAR